MKNIKRRHKPYTKLKAFLDENGINQKELASLLNKSTSAINQNLNGTGGDFSVSEVRTICIKYGISSDEFFLYPEVSKTKQDKDIVSSARDETCASSA
ncbi:hypothetical protein GCM10023310_00520 [Paenibacillus vulneris]|uniref:Helix-turn-helix domain-containing protein n=1 Tax=Paenibacillus vulneris TaxID=1133364 RepID=A0ABW3V024_9BACL